MGLCHELGLCDSAYFGFFSAGLDTVKLICVFAIVGSFSTQSPVRARKTPPDQPFLCVRGRTNRRKGRKDHAVQPCQISCHRIVHGDLGTKAPCCADRLTTSKKCVEVERGFLDSTNTSETCGRKYFA